MHFKKKSEFRGLVFLLSWGYSSSRWGGNALSFLCGVLHFFGVGHSVSSPRWRGGPRSHSCGGSIFFDGADSLTFAHMGGQVA